MVSATLFPKRTRRTRVSRQHGVLSTLLTVGLLVCGTNAAHSAPKPELWGYGVRSCADYLRAYEATESAKPTDYQRYEDWLTGFISGLNLALGEDVLNGSGITAAMERAREHCEGNPGDDFFTATMGLVRQLSSLR